MKIKSSITLIVLLFLITSCDVMQGVSAGLGTCSYTAKFYSLNNNAVWENALYYKKSLSDETKTRIRNWATQRLEYYSNLKLLGTYYENDPYSNEQYQFKVECI
ncbi:hypothetical protein ACEN2I_01615 [Flavobacterium sp. W22_SRS_FK3]|uniref:hypothetical protein n=1 Tax=Flavobacterium sp. W22_SRS_FK3 TaxID=3240275 RepID=UPI003F91BAD0